jgi:hypothetical protein
MDQNEKLNKILAQKIGEEVVLLNSSGRMIIYKVLRVCGSKVEGRRDSDGV